jgi:hypothetical protein
MTTELVLLVLLVEVVTLTGVKSVNPLDVQCAEKIESATVWAEAVCEAGQSCGKQVAMYPSPPGTKFVQRAEAFGSRAAVVAHELLEASSALDPIVISRKIAE